MSPWSAGIRRTAEYACVILAANVPVSAQSPRDLTIVAPAAPGGGWDQTARVMQHVLREAGFAQSVQVVNSAGAAGTIGLARFVSSETGNANALLITGLVMVSGIATNRSPVTLDDVTPIARLSGEYEVIVVPASSPLRSLADLVAAFRANPRAVSWGGGSAGGTDEILVRLLAERLDVDPVGVNYIAYSGGGQALASVLGAHVTAAVSGLGEFGSQIESGALRALAISSPERIAGVSVPTFREQGVDLVLMNWRGVVAPPGLSRSERNDIVELMGRMAASEQWKAALRRNGWSDIYMEGDAFVRFLVDETARVSAVVGADAGKRGSGGFELFVLIGGGIAIIATAASRSFRRRATPSTKPASISREPAEYAPSRVSRAPAENWGKFALLALGLILDIALIENVGFVISSTLMFWLTARAFGSRRPVRDAVVGLAIASAIHVGFTNGLGVPLPRGLFG